ncbi:MAG: hypothetical protein FJ102_11545 [Deltaproteobacteria bacterium]|nr:hypothetical protein [Deltaproteobacteria bacterium]
MILALLASAQATMVAKALDPFALAILSDATAFGDVTEVETRWEGGMIWTVATLSLVDLDEEAEVWIPGGCMSGLCLTVAGTPWVDEGERVFVFLRDEQPTSLAQGLFHVEGDVAVRDTEGLAVREGAKPQAAYEMSEIRRAEATVPRRRGG